MQKKNSRTALYFYAFLCICVVFFITACWLPGDKTGIACQVKTFITENKENYTAVNKITDGESPVGMPVNSKKADSLAGNAASSKVQVLKLCSSASTDLVRDLVNDFSNRTGIIVELSPLAPEPLSARLRHVKESDCDIWLGGSAEEYYIAGRRNMLLPVHPATAVYIPARFRDLTDRWLPLWVDHIAILSNREKTAKMRIAPPENWSDLLQPVLYSEIALTDPHSGGASYGMITSIWQWDGEKEAMRYASDLRTQKPLYTKSREAAAAAVISGKCSVAVLAENYARMLEKNNSKLYAARVKAANKDMLTAVAVLKSCDNRKSADKFMHYIFTDEAAAIMESYDIVPLSRMESDRELLPDLNGVSVDSPKGDLWWMADKKKYILKKWFTALPSLIEPGVKRSVRS